MPITLSGLVIITTLLANMGKDANAELESYLRGTLEENFKASTGLGFQFFGCTIAEHVRAGNEFECQAIDEDSDRFGYLIQIDPEGQMSFSMFQPISQTTAEGRKILESQVTTVLTAFEESDWQSMHDGFAPGLQEVISAEQMQTSLSILRESLGDLRRIEADNYASPEPQAHDLDYSIYGINGDALARFRLRLDETGQPGITAFIMIAKPGSALQGKLIEQSAIKAFSPVFGRTVTRVEAPLELLHRKGDAVEGIAILEDSSSRHVRVEQASSIHNFESNRYQFQVLDIPFLVHRYLDKTGTAAKNLDCPSPTAPDGGKMTCMALLENGASQEITMERRGGDHRLVQ